MKQSPEISANFCGQLVFIQQRYQDDSMGGESFEKNGAGTTGYRLAKEWN